MVHMEIQKRRRDCLWFILTNLDGDLPITLGALKRLDTLFHDLFGEQGYRHFHSPGKLGFPNLKKLLLDLYI